MHVLVRTLMLLSLAACQPVVQQQVASASPSIAAAGDPVSGLDVADRNCSLCHAIGREGASPHPKAPPFRTLAGKYPLDSLGEALAEGIVVGHSGMPQIQLEPQKISDLISYLKSVQRTAPD